MHFKKTNFQKYSDYFLTFIGQIGVMVCLLVTNKIISYTSTVEDFGVYNLVRRNSAVLCFIMLGGTGIALPRYLSMYVKQGLYFSAKNYLLSILAYMLLASFLTAVIGLALFPWLGEMLVGTYSVTFYMVLFAYSFGTALSSLVFAYYRGQNKFGIYNGGQLFIHLLLIVPLFMLKYISFSQLFLIWAVMYFVATLAVYIFEGKKYKWVIHRKTSLVYLKPCFYDIAAYSAPRLVGDSFLFLISAFPLLYISLSLGMTSVSHFSVGLSLLTMATPLFSVLGIILLPYVSSSLVQGKMVEASKFVGKLSVIYLLVALSITAIFILSMPFLIKVFFAEKYLVAMPLAQILILSLLPESMYLLYRNPIDAVSKVPYNTYIMFVSLLALIVSFLFCSDLQSYAWAYFCVATFRGLASLLVWQNIKFKNI